MLSHQTLPAEIQGPERKLRGHGTKVLALLEFKSQPESEEPFSLLGRRNSASAPAPKPRVPVPADMIVGLVDHCGGKHRGHDKAGVGQPIPGPRQGRPTSKGCFSSFVNGPIRGQQQHQVPTSLDTTF